MLEDTISAVITALALLGGAIGFTEYRIRIVESKADKANERIDTLLQGGRRD